MKIETGTASFDFDQAQQPIVCAVDIGTSSLKAGMIDAGGTLLAWARVPFELEEHGPLETWPAETWWDAFITALRSFPHPTQISAVAISGNGPTIVPVDAQGRSLSAASLWINRRDKFIQGEPSFFLPKIAWIAEQHPEIYEHTVAFLGCPEYVTYRLTGEKTAFTPSSEFSPYIWEPSGIEAYGFLPEKFPPLLTDRAGRGARQSQSRRRERIDGRNSSSSNWSRLFNVPAWYGRYQVRPNLRPYRHFRRNQLLQRSENKPSAD